MRRRIPWLLAFPALIGAVALTAQSVPTRWLSGEDTRPKDASIAATAANESSTRPVQADAWSPKASDEPGARLVFYDVGPEYPNGPPALVSRLRDTDSSIEVVRRGPLPSAFSTDREAADELKMLTERSHAALTVRIDRIDSRLSDNERWLASTVTATVESVLKNVSSNQLQEGAIFTFETSGGVLQIDGQTIYARNGFERLQKPGRTYLMFFVEFKGRLWPERGLNTFDVSSGTVTRLGHAPEGPLDRGVTSATALGVVRAAATSTAQKGGDK